MSENEFGIWKRRFPCLRDMRRHMPLAKQIVWPLASFTRKVRDGFTYGCFVISTQYRHMCCTSWTVSALMNIKILPKFL
jgi:hypothetical protein